MDNTSPQMSNEAPSTDKGGGDFDVKSLNKEECPDVNDRNDTMGAVVPDDSSNETTNYNNKNMPLELDEERVEDCGRIVREILLDYIEEASVDQKKPLLFDEVLKNELMHDKDDPENDSTAWAADMGEMIEECKKWSIADKSSSNASVAEKDEDLRKWSKTKITWNDDVCAHQSRERLYEELLQSTTPSLDNVTENADVAVEEKASFGECDFCGESLSYPLHFDHVWDTESDSEIDQTVDPNSESHPCDRKPSEDSQKEGSGLTTVGPIKTAKTSTSLSKVVNFGKMIEVQEIELDENCSKCSEKRIEKYKCSTLRDMANKTKKGFQRASSTLPRRFPVFSSSASSSSASAPSNIKAAVLKGGRSLLSITTNLFGRTSTAPKEQECIQTPECGCSECVTKHELENQQRSSVEVLSLPRFPDYSDGNEVKPPKKSRGFYKLAFWKKDSHTSDDRNHTIDNQ